MAQETDHEAITIAALYIDPRGPYPQIPGVDAWDEMRDARAYAGPHAIVAHPPCGPWGRLRHLYCGTEHDCGPRAVEQVRAFGGVLEHPAGSKLWEAASIPRPRVATSEFMRRATDRGPLGFAPERDDFGGFSLEIDQCEWGHVARKRTWLYLVGVPREALEAPPFPGRAPTHWVSGSMNDPARPPHIKICSAQQRRRTPPLFAEYLVRLARSVRL